MCVCVCVCVCVLCVCVRVRACVSDLSKAEYVRDVEPGEMVLISLKTGVF